jgi:hypothetical protein
LAMKKKIKLLFKNLVIKICATLLYLYNQARLLNWQTFLKSGVVVLFLGYVILYINLKKQSCIFKYTHLPEDLSKQGYTEKFVINQINQIKRAISEYTPELRDDGEDDRTRADKFKNFDSFSSDQMETIEHLEIGGISIEALIVLTDKLVGFFGIDPDNYLSLEYTKVGDRILQLTAKLGSHHEVFQDTVVSGNIHFTLALLNVRAAKMILQKKNPSLLLAYQYNQNNNLECERLCRKTLLEFSNKKVLADAYGYLGLSSSDYSIYLQSLKKASLLDSENEEWKNLLFLIAAYSSADIMRSLDSLIVVYPNYFPFHQERFTYHSLYVQDTTHATQKFNQYVALIRKNFPDYSSTVHYYYAELKSKWGEDQLSWLDSATVEYKKAINWESRVTKTHKPSTALLANYYNNLAFNFEKKILYSNKSCADSMKRNYRGYLDSCYLYVSQAVQIDPKNRWAWSTMAEYYGWQYRTTEGNQYLDAFKKNLKTALLLGFIPTWSSPPYCLLIRDKETILLEVQKNEVSEREKELRTFNLVADVEL